MDQNKAPSTPTITIVSTVVAALGLVVSLAGNVIQYQLLSAKKEELKQTQTKLDDAQQESKRRRDAADQYIANLQARISSIDTEIDDAKMEQRRGASGIVYAPLDQKEIAMQILASARETEQKLVAERAKLQEKLDAARALGGQNP